MVGTIGVHFEPMPFPIHLTDSLASGWRRLHPRNLGCQFSRQRIPESLAVSPADIFQKVLVELSRKFPLAGFFTVEADIIRVHVQQRHSAVRRDPIQFLNPGVRRGLTEEEEEGKVLR